MKFKVELFPETKDLDETFADLKAHEGVIELDTAMFDGLDEVKRKELTGDIEELLKWCGRVILLEVENYSKTEDKSRIESILHRMLITSRSLH